MTLALSLVSPLYIPGVTFLDFDMAQRMVQPEHRRQQR